MCDSCVTRLGGADELDVVLVQRVDQRDETPRLINARARVQHWDVRNKHRVELLCDGREQGTGKKNKERGRC